MTAATPEQNSASDKTSNSNKSEQSDKNEPFKEKVKFLFITAFVTSIAAPIITGLVQTSWTYQQKIAEAELSRQNSLLKDQDDLLKRIQEKLFDYRIKIVKPAWYKYKDENKKKYDDAFEEYDRAGWQFHGDMHQELTNVKRLASKEIYDMFNSLYQKFVELDNRLLWLSQRTDASKEEWRDLLNDANRVIDDIQNFIVKIADYFRLTSSGQSNNTFAAFFK
jgi:hypothetical protein